MLKKIKKVRKFSSRAMCLGQALASIGKSRYKLVRRLLKPLNLPSLRTVQRQRSHVKMKPGVQEIGFRLLREIVSENRQNPLRPIDKLAVLVIDETCIDDKIVYAEDLGKLMSKNKVNVIEVKSLTGAFDQIIYANFNDDFGRDGLLNIIERLHDMGITTIAFTGDNGALNQALWQQLDVSHQNPFFEHLGMKIFAFSDMSHNVKLFRNHAVKRRFRIPASDSPVNEGFRGIEIYPRPALERLTANENNDLLKKHIDLEGPDGQKSRKIQDVGLALKVINRKISGDILQIGYERESEFISVGSEYFEIFNHTDNTFLSHTNKDTVSARLRIISDYISSFRMAKPDNKEFHESLMPFQKGIVMSCNALISLMDHLTQLFGTELSFPSHKLSSDTIECKFSRLKSHYGTKPNPVLFMMKLKIMILCGFAGPSASINVPHTTPRENIDEGEEQMSFSDLLDEVVHDIDINSDEQLDEETLEELRRIENRDDIADHMFDALHDAENINTVVDYVFENTAEHQFFRRQARNFLIARITWLLEESEIEYNHDNLLKLIRKKMYEKANHLQQRRAFQEEREDEEDIEDYQLRANIEDVNQSINNESIYFSMSE